MSNPFDDRYAICLCAFRVYEVLSKTQCAHFFHWDYLTNEYEAFTRCQSRPLRCPLCNKDYRSNNTHPTPFRFTRTELIPLHPPSLPSQPPSPFQPLNAAIAEYRPFDILCVAAMISIVIIALLYSFLSN
ncbi:hypothetical protein M0R45_003347 [Rubus argutus]|uniref:RING-type domain-containing protein n=1 Tax=Rubus argutus TaxID=59490 RepID=A0AAW1YG72_RUBAR